MPLQYARRSAGTRIRIRLAFLWAHTTPRMRCPHEGQPGVGLLPDLSVGLVRSCRTQMCRQEAVPVPEAAADYDTNSVQIPAEPPAPAGVVALCWHHLALIDGSRAQSEDAWVALPTRLMTWAPVRDRSTGEWQPEWTCLRRNAWVTSEHPMLQQVPAVPCCAAHGPRTLALDIAHGQRGWVCCQGRGQHRNPCPARGWRRSRSSSSHGKSSNGPALNQRQHHSSPSRYSRRRSARKHKRLPGLAPRGSAGARRPPVTLSQERTAGCLFRCCKPRPGICAERLQSSGKDMPFLGQCGGKLFSTSTALPRSHPSNFASN